MKIAQFLLLLGDNNLHPETKIIMLKEIIYHTVTCGEFSGTGILGKSWRGTVVVCVSSLILLGLGPPPGDIGLVCYIFPSLMESLQCL